MAPFSSQDSDFEARIRESFGRLNLMMTIGARLLTVAPGEVEIDLPFREDLTQHHGFLAAAVLTAIGDVACGYAAMSLMPPGATVLTVEYKASFVAPARGDRMVARSRVVRPGRTVSTCIGDVFAVTDDHEELVATMLATMIQVGGEREEKTPPEHGSHRERGAGHRERARPWCVCRGGGLRRTLRQITGARP